MSLAISRRVRGNLHGSIDLSELEDRVVAHPIFQRLRRIKQTAFLSLVFPGASHTRFEHSLGVMHLAGTAWERLRQNQLRVEASCLRIPGFAYMETQRAKESGHGSLAPTFVRMHALFESRYVQQCLRLAALLHDVGHPPYSHSGERFLPSYAQLLEENPELPDYLVTFLTARKDATSDAEAPVSHEIFTVLLADRLLSEVQREDTSGEDYVRVAPRDVAAILIPELGCTADSPLTQLGAHSLCHELVSGEIDVDRIDYLQRDSEECGVIYGHFDVDRLMDSFALYFQPDDGEMHLAIQFSGLAAFEDYLRARQSMYVQLYFHKTSVACDAMMQRLLRLAPGWRLPAQLSEYVAVDEHNVTMLFSRYARERGLEAATLSEFEGLLADVFRHRRLWKRVYELSTSFAGVEKDVDQADEVGAALERAGIAYERISSRSHVTSFRPRHDDAPSSHYLRLIKKDAKQFPTLVPVEDFSYIARSDSEIAIERLYVSAENGERAQKLLMATFYP